MISHGNLLALLADSDQRWRRLQARCLLRQPPPLHGRIQLGAPGLQPAHAAPGPEATFDIAAATRPFRLRVERVPGSQAWPAEAPDLAVDDGTALWLQAGFDVQQLRHRTPSDPWVVAVSRLLVPRGLSAGHRLSALGDGEVAGRACWRVQAQAVRDPPPIRDTDGELLIDQQTGLVLSQHWRRQGVLVSSAEMTTLDVDGPAQPELFTFTPPPGAHITPGAPLLLPVRYRPAMIVGLLTAVAGDAVARLVGALGRGQQK